MAQLAIKGHATRGKEVIELLEMLGGENYHYLDGKNTNNVYTIDSFFSNAIVYMCYGTDSSDTCNRVFTLEEFLEKFPYKVGDKVKCWIDGYRSVANIKDMHWDSIPNKIKYKIGDYWHDALNLEPFEEEIVDEMNKAVFEGTMEEKSVNHVYDVDVISFDIAQKDIYELDLKDNFHVILREGKYYVERIKPKYPKNYKECCDILGYKASYDLNNITTHDCVYDYKLQTLYRLLICRDAYWKIAGEQMGLGKPWKPDYTKNEELYCIYNYWGEIIKDKTTLVINKILFFPTEEMRDTFYVNFEELIEACKELL